MMIVYWLYIIIAEIHLVGMTVNLSHYYPPPYRYGTLEQDATVISERLESAEGVLGEREGQLVQAREEIQTLTEDLKASQGKVTLQGCFSYIGVFPN